MSNKIKRVVITGPVGVGKTSFIRTITGNQFVNTERKATDNAKVLKPQTTVGMDFGRYEINSNLILHVYGTPGQSRFNFMWDFLISTASSYILLVCANRPEELDRARNIFQFMNQRVKVPMLIGVTNYDAEDSLSQIEITKHLGFDNRMKQPLCVNVNPQDINSVKTILNISARQIERDIIKQFRQSDRSRSGAHQKLSSKQSSPKVKVSAKNQTKYTPLFGGLNI